MNNIIPPSKHVKPAPQNGRLVPPISTIASRFDEDSLDRIIGLRQPPSSCPLCSRGNAGKLSIPYNRIYKLICHDCSHVWSGKAARKAMVH